MEKALVIFNPQAGRGRAHRRTRHLLEALEAASLPYEIVISEERGHAIELSRRAVLAGRQLVVAAGGDGTINEVVNGLMQAAAEGVHGMLGVLPVGTGNDFASNLGIPADLRQAAQRLVQAQTRCIDLGQVNGRFFDNNMGIGFEAMIGIEAHKPTRLSGRPQYLAAAFRAMTSYPLPVVDIHQDGGTTLAKEILLISVGNNRRIGGGFLLTPYAEPDDGQLDVCVVDALPRREILRLLPKAATGQHEGEPAVCLTRTTRLIVESEEPLPIHTDGEVLWLDAHRVEVTVEPARLEVIV
jgi:diacylglycerol kinase (ATP)